MLAACGGTHAAFDRRSIPAEPLRFAAFCVAFRSKYTRYSSLTRLVSRTPTGRTGRRSMSPRFCADRRYAVRSSEMGGAQRCWCGFRAPARCRSETGAPCPRDSTQIGDTPFAAVRLAGRSVVGAGFALPRDAGRRPALHVPAILRGWRTAERAKTMAANSVRCPRDRGESVKGGLPPPFHKSTMTNRNSPPRAAGAQGSFDCRREAPGGPRTGPQLQLELRPKAIPDHGPVRGPLDPDCRSEAPTGRTGQRSMSPRFCAGGVLPSAQKQWWRTPFAARVIGGKV